MGKRKERFEKRIATQTATRRKNSARKAKERVRREARQAAKGTSAA